MKKFLSNYFYYTPEEQGQALRFMLFAILFLAVKVLIFHL